MSIRSLSGIVSAIICAVVLSACCTAGAAILSADKYLSTKKSLHATPGLQDWQTNSSGYVGKTIELAGKVEGYVTAADFSTFLFSTDEGGYVVKTTDPLPDSAMNGNMVRILVKVGPDSATTSPDLSLEAAAFDYDVTIREREIAEKSKSRVSASATYRGSDPELFYAAQQGRGVNLSSRAMQIYDPYRAAIARFNPRLNVRQLDTITSSILAYSERYGVDPRLVIALIIAESGFKPEATSSHGAMGLCQLMPGTARGLGVSDAYDPEQNIEASIRLMRGHLDKYGDLALALSAYNAGSGAVRKYGGVPPYRQTRSYIAKITKIYKALCGN